jgi:hypothetical protein
MDKIASGLNQAIGYAQGQREAMQWQPIQTAPKDGTDILVCGHGVIRTAQWSAKDQTFRVNAYAFIRIDPTHWMPLPDPPATGESK